MVALADIVRPDVASALAEMRGLGIRHLLLLTGDNERVAAAIGGPLGLEYRAGLLPEDKIACGSRPPRESAWTAAAQLSPVRRRGAAA